MKFNSLLKYNQKWTNLLLLSVAISPFSFILLYPRLPKVLVILLTCAATSYAFRISLRNASNLKWMMLVILISFVAIFISMMLLALTQFTSLGSVRDWMGVGVSILCFQTATMLINRLKY